MNHENFLFLVTCLLVGFRSIVTKKNNIMWDVINLSG